MTWLDLRETDTLFVRHTLTRRVHKERSAFQEIEVVDTVDFGRMLLLDGVIQTSARDEFIYHEMLVHVPLFTHPNPEYVLVIGGGDGGAVREVLKHASVKQVHLVEIDERVIEVARAYLPETSRGLADPRVKITIGDGIAHVAEVAGAYDVILVDGPDPLGAAEGLFTSGFYRNVRRALRADGLFAAHTESAFLEPDVVVRIYRNIADAFPVSRLYLSPVPSFSPGPWSFTLGLLRPDLLERPRKPEPGFPTRYYNAAIHDAAFALPQFLAERLGVSGGSEGSPAIR